MIALDTETTGVDLFHNARPFFVTICDEEDNQTSWQWEVDPITRKVEVDYDDVKKIETVIEVAKSWGKGFSQDIADRHRLVLQNPKFDVTALEGIGLYDWPWNQTFDTLLAGHLLSSNSSHTLTAMAKEYIGWDIKPLEDALEEACTEARSICRQHLPEWRIAETGMVDDDGREMMPSLKKTAAEGERDRAWANDMWLPRALALYTKEPDDHPWYKVLSTYSNADSAVTIRLWKEMRRLLEKEGLWEIYLSRLQLLSIAHKMEKRGVTVSRERLDELYKLHSEEADRCSRICVNIATGYGYELEMPKAGRNGSLEDFLFGWVGFVCNLCGHRKKDVRSMLELDDDRCEKCLKKRAKCKTERGRSKPVGRLVPKEIKGLGLQPILNEETGNVTMDKDAMEEYEDSLEQGSIELAFIKALQTKKRRSTAVTYMDGYRRFWLPLGVYNENGEQCWQLYYAIHPQLNPTGTNTLRWSCQNPNEQNISKQEEANLRYCFGPAPGREWWSADAKNVELRIPAYEVDETELVYVFEHPNDAPYYGSYHLVVFDTLHPALFKEHGKKCKDLFESTWYQWVKNGNFAILYGAQRAKADLTYHVQGAYDLIQDRFPRIAKLSKRQMAMAEQLGYVETIPDKSIYPADKIGRGYPLNCSRTQWGKIKPTIPLNYHVSGTAMWWTGKSMIRTQAKLDEWNVRVEAQARAIHDQQQRIRDYVESEGWHIALQVHDELVFDFPKAAHPVKDPKNSNLVRARVLQRLMEQGGVDIGLPTPVGLEYHETHWASGVTI